MTNKARWIPRCIPAGTVLGVLMLTGCAGRLPPITVTFPAPPVVEPPVPPVVEPAPAPPLPLVNLNITVLDGAARPIPKADVTAWSATHRCTVLGRTAQGALEGCRTESRIADGGGFVNFAVTGSVFVLVQAPGFVARDVELPPGDHRVHLGAIAPPPLPAPPVVVAPEPAMPSTGLCASRTALDPLTCVRTVAAHYPQLLVTNTYESCLEFTQRVLAALGPDYGHVAKTAGESQAVPRGFTPIDAVGSDGNTYRITGVSHDAIKHRITGQVVDLLGNASANSDPDPKIHGPASVQWSLVPPEHWRAQNPFIPAVPVR